jgi:DNA polymerase-1
MNKQTDKKTALIDLELLLFSHSAKAESTGTSLKSCVEMLEFSIANIVNRTHASDYYLVVSGPKNFRKVLYPDYKFSRPPKPPLYKPLFNAIKGINQSKWIAHEQLEADDAIGLAATAGRVENPIICSIDKDLRTIPGWHYSWMHDDWPGYVSGEEASMNWLTQLLMGDSCDGIRGMEGIGPVKARKMIEDHFRSTLRPAGEGLRMEDVPSIAKDLYEKHGFSLDDYYKALYLVTIWKLPFPQELLQNDLISEITKTIDSIKNKT